VADALLVGVGLLFAKKKKKKKTRIRNIKAIKSQTPIVLANTARTSRLKHMHTYSGSTYVCGGGCV
jgi:hypothetical protein